MRKATPRSAQRLSIPDAAFRSGFSDGQIRRLLHTHQLIGGRDSTGHWFVTAASLDAYVAAAAEQPTPAA